MRAKLSILLMCITALMLGGCNNSRQIESASIIENVSVDEKDGQRVYTFYLLTSDEKPWGISVVANSFEEACGLAKEQYIPNLSLAKLELLMINEKIYSDVMQKDVEYISTQPSFSPIAYVTLCDSGTMKKFGETNRTQMLIEDQLVMLKKNNPDVNINYLSIFNNYANKDEDEFMVPYVSSDNELKVSEFKITKKK